MSYSSKPSLEGVTVNGSRRLAGRQPLELRDADLDHETSAGPEVRGGVLEAGHLIVLRGQVVDRVVDQVGQRELARHPGGGEVAQRDLDPIGAGLGPELLHHLAREVDAAHRDAAPGERQRDPAGADAELQRSAVSGQPGQEVDGRLDHRGVEHLGAAVVVALGHTLTEVVVALLAAHARHSTPACRGAAANGCSCGAISRLRLSLATTGRRGSPPETPSHRPAR